MQAADRSITGNGKERSPSSESRPAAFDFIFRASWQHSANSRLRRLAAEPDIFLRLIMDVGTEITKHSRIAQACMHPTATLESAPSDPDYVLPSAIPGLKKTMQGRRTDLDGKNARTKRDVATLQRLTGKIN